MANAPKVYGLFEAAEAFGMTRNNFNLHRKRFAGEDQCPAPTVELKCGPVWVGSDVTRLEKWAASYHKSRAAVTDAAAKKRAAKAEKVAAVKAVADTTEPADAPAKKAVAKKAAAKKAPAAKKAAPKKSAGKLFGKTAA